MWFPTTQQQTAKPVGSTTAAGLQTTTIICMTQKRVRPQGKYKEVIKSTACFHRQQH